VTASAPISLISRTSPLFVAGPAGVGSILREKTVAGFVPQHLISKWHNDFVGGADMAEETTNALRRLAFMGMAQSWLRLAEQAEKNSHTDLVYELGRSIPCRGPFLFLLRG
jgi:hypothetical protein